MQQHDPIPWVDLGDEVEEKNVSEYGHVAFQIKWNHECSNMVANILPADSPPPNSRPKFNFFRTW